MAFFDDLGKKVSKAAQVAAKKSGDLVEITKLNAQISSKEDTIKANYIKIGTICYEGFQNGDASLSPQVSEVCQEINNINLQIDDLKKQIEAIKQNDEAE